LEEALEISFFFSLHILGAEKGKKKSKMGKLVDFFEMNI